MWRAGCVLLLQASDYQMHNTIYSQGMCKYVCACTVSPLLSISFPLTLSPFGPLFLCLFPSSFYLNYYCTTLFVSLPPSLCLYPHSVHVKPHDLSQQYLLPVFSLSSSHGHIPHAVRSCRKRIMLVNKPS